MEISRLWQCAVVIYIDGQTSSVLRGIAFEIGILVDVIDERLSGLWSIGAIVVMDIDSSAIFVALVPNEFSLVVDKTGSALYQQSTGIASRDCKILKCTAIKCHLTGRGTSAKRIPIDSGAACSRSTVFNVDIGHIQIAHPVSAEAYYASVAVIAGAALADIVNADIVHCDCAALTGIVFLVLGN